ncbi:TetR/AcrR family transcriptional regulator [Arenicella sp. 4NH20-0111]|uniref:TetR/AcrR family transcriptional regulator n=1 Tax=Arenicella sp. 4NH20-0111 TaxID=3127648 RepID=UPI0031063DBA
MPYSKVHKQQTRELIVENARVLFNRHGFHGVSIDVVMESVGLTRGGFYNHFKSKEELYREAVSSFLMGRGAQWRDSAGIDLKNLDPEMARQMLKSYLSTEHLGDIDGQCPMIALPSDVAREKPDVQASYQMLLEAMVSLFTDGLNCRTGDVRRKALSLAALAVGGMVLARSLPDSSLAKEIQDAALTSANELIDSDEA